jgi:hypothetical protein
LRSAISGFSRGKGFYIEKGETQNPKPFSEIRRECKLPKLSKPSEKQWVSIIMSIIAFAPEHL